MLLYIHAPFCKRKCAYCGFVSYENRENEAEAYFTNVLKEAEQRKDEFCEPFTTLYIGGGTPSLVPSQTISGFLKDLRKILDLRNLTEASVEANPGTLTEKWLKAVRGEGINRISIGLQSASRKLLRTLGRIHGIEEAVESVRLVRQCGFDNLNLDLMFGIPGQTMNDWLETLEYAVSLEPEHISIYGLIPEEDTPLKRDLDSGKISLPDPDAESEMYDTGIQFLAEKGFSQYEISNFAKPGYECKHNVGYWSQIPYAGLGISAASMSKVRKTDTGISYERRKNPDTFEAYASMTHSSNNENCEIEPVGERDARFETIMLNLRMNMGLNEAAFFQMHHCSFKELYADKLQTFVRGGLIVHEDGCWRLTRRGMDIQNLILVELMDN